MYMYLLTAMIWALSLFISPTFSSFAFVAASALLLLGEAGMGTWSYIFIASTEFLSFSLRNSSNMVALCSKYFSADSSFFSSAYMTYYVTIVWAILSSVPWLSPPAFVFHLSWLLVNTIDQLMEHTPIAYSPTYLHQEHLSLLSQVAIQIFFFDSSIFIINKIHLREMAWTLLLFYLNITHVYCWYNVLVGWGGYQLCPYDSYAAIVYSLPL